MEDLGDLLEIERLSFPTCRLEEFIKRAFRDEVMRLWLAYIPAESYQTAGYLSAIRIINKMHLLQIATHPKYRRAGVATALLRHAMDAERGLKNVLLEVRENNAAAISFYTKMDFDCIGKHPGYYTDTREDALLFVRELS